MWRHIVINFFPKNHIHSIHTWNWSRLIFDEVWNFYLTDVTFLQETLKCFLFSLKVWTHLRQQQYFRQQHGNEVQWARRFYVQIRSLKELDDLVRELKLRLSREGIDSSKESSPWDKNELALVLKVAIYVILQFLYCVFFKLIYMFLNDWMTR